MTTQMYAGGYVDMTPVIVNGKPLKMSDPLNPQRVFGEVFVIKDRDTNKERAVMKRPMGGEGYTVTNPETAEQVSHYWEDLYRRPDGQLYHHRVEASEGMQTCGRYEAIGGGRQRDLYLSKPGWRWAVAEDVLAVLARAEKNSADQAERNRARDPLEANKIMATTLANALAERDTKKRGGMQ